jgi:hypothetical protein
MTWYLHYSGISVFLWLSRTIAPRHQINNNTDRQQVRERERVKHLIIRIKNNFILTLITLCFSSQPSLCECVSSISISMTISQFFILSPRGDCIISKDFRGDAHATMHEDFFRKVKFWEKGDAPPVFLMDGINFMYIRRNSLLIACTSRYVLYITFIAVSSS